LSRQGAAGGWSLPSRPQSVTMSNMKHVRQAGAVNLLVIPLILLTVLLVGVASVAFSFYNEAQDNKNNVARKVAVAVDQAKEEVSVQKDKDFAEKAKFPYDRYDGPSSFGALRILYPKTWSAYVSEPRNNTNRPVEGYFAPGFVPTLNDQQNTFALRVVVEQRRYDSVLKEYDDEVKQGKTAARPYQSPNVPNIVGTRLDGEVAQRKQGAMIIMPMRDKTLRLWTESRDYVADFDNIILPNFSFSP
jgi:hypothetical protein